MQEPQPISIKALFEVGTFDAHMQAVSLRSKVSHLSVFAFAPISLNMQLGVVIGNKSEAMTCQWERTHENWGFPRKRNFNRQAIAFDPIPSATGQDQV